MKRSVLIMSLQSSVMAMLAATLLSSCNEAEKAVPSGTEPAKQEAIEKTNSVDAPAKPAKEEPSRIALEEPAGIAQAESPAASTQGAAVPEAEKEAVPAEAALVGLDDKKPMKEENSAVQGQEVVTLGGGCFWCTEAVIERLEGVIDVVSGYMGGHVENPTYEQITTKTTGHAEVIEVTFDPAVISLAEILDVFWQAHDPTTLNQQGADIGPQYRSVIFYHSAEQKNIAMESMKKLNESGMYPDQAVTEISAASKFWVAEDDHQNYYVQNKDKPYCRVVISPKLKKLGME